MVNILTFFNNLEVISIDDECIFEEKMKAMKLREHVVEGDGNCFFRALSHQIFSNEELHIELRDLYCRFLKTQRDSLTDYFDDPREIDKYIQRMSQSGCWAGELDIKLMSQAVQRSILLYSSACLDEFPRLYEFESPKDVPALRISHRNDKHFNSVRSV